jgi:DNA-binding protein HU-beta
MRLEELDVVELTREFPYLARGTQGTVVLVYPSGRQVEVEFVDREGNTLGVESVPTDFLRKVARAPKTKKKTITKADLVDQVAATTGLKKKDAKAAVDAFLVKVEQALATGNKVQLTGFGSLEVRKRKARTGVKPGTKEKIKQVPVYGDPSQSSSPGANEVQELMKLLAKEGNIPEEAVRRILKLLGRLAAQKRVTWKAIKGLAE